MPPAISTAKDINPLDAHRPETWIDYRWRPMAAWIYLLTCFADFFLFPILWPILLAAIHSPVTPWHPITMEGAGLYHMAMGTIIGVTSWRRSDEKITAFNNNPFIPGGNSVVTDEQQTDVIKPNNTPPDDEDKPPAPVLHPH